MKKTFKLMAMMMALILGGAGFTSCGSDENDGELTPSENNNQNTIAVQERAFIGQWLCTEGIAKYEYKSPDGQTVSETEQMPESQRNRLQINADHTYAVSFLRNQQWVVEDHGTWSLSGNQVTITPKDDKYRDVQNATITQMTDNSFVMISTQQDEDGSISITYTYTRTQW